MWFLVFLVTGALVLGMTPGYAMARGAVDVGKAVRVLRSDASGIVFVVDVPEPEVTQQVAGDRVYDVISLPEWGKTAEVGHPQLPTRRFLLGIPLDAEVAVRVVGDVAREAGPYHVLPAPETVLLTEISGHPEQWARSPEFEKRYGESAEVYGSDAYYPEAVARVGEIGFIRDQRVAAIEVNPIQLNPATGEIRIHTQIQVELSFDYPAGQKGSPSARPESAVFERILESQLLNYLSAKAWRDGPAAAPGPASWPLPSDAFKMVVTQDGLYQLSYDDLDSAGVPMDQIDPQTFQIFLLGEEMAIRVVGEEDGDFDPGDYVLFYGQKIEDKYTAENVYWLTYGQAAGRRMPEQNGQPDGSLPHPVLFPVKEHAEQNSVYINAWPGEDSKDRWAQQSLEAPGSVSISMQLQNISTETITSTLWVLMWGQTSIPQVNPDHHARFYVNEQYIGEYWWDGNLATPYVPVDFPTSVLTGTNTLRVTFPDDTGATTDKMVVDYFDLGFGHAPLADNNQLEFVQDELGDWEFEIAGFTSDAIEVYDLSDPWTVSRIVNATIEPVMSTYTVRFTDTVSTTQTYLALTAERWLDPEAIVADVPSDLHDPANGADYIVISPADFLEAAESLANHRAAQGMRTRVAELEDVYDEFGYGLTVPDAIQAFLRYAFSYWQAPAPTYVVLMGDGTYDPKGYVNTGVVNYLSPYLANVDPWMGETAADNRYVSLIGDDIWPDMVLGRLPVNSAAQASIVASKTMTYEQNQHGQDWNNRLVFVTDNPDDGGDFYAFSDDLVDNFVPEPYSATRLYYGASGTCYPKSICRQQIIDSLNMTGTLMVNYIGHGYVKGWAGEDLLTVNTIPSLNNASQLSIMLPMTCLEGYYIHPYNLWPSLSESLVRAEDKGAVASWAPTGLGVSYGHDLLSKGYYNAVFFQDFREFGPATYMGKLRLYQSGSHLEQIEEYLVMGDPALRINALDPELQIEKAVEPVGQVEPGDILTYTLTFTNAGLITAHQVALTDIVPSQLVSPTVLFTSPEVLTEHQGITFAWSITDLLPHTGGEVQFRAMVSPEAGPGVIVNEAEIASPASRDVVSVTNGMQVPDLFVVKTGPVTATFEQVMTYTISWGNEGATAAPNVHLTDTLPAWVEYVGDSSGFPLTQPSPGILVWEVSPDPVLPGDDGSFEVTVQVTVAQPTTATLVNRVRIGSSLPDGDPFDDEDQWSTEIVDTGSIYLYLPMMLKTAP
jgi:uncharacterized repeat protein (TIGR01451 family)